MHNDSFLCIAQLFFSYSVCTIFYMIPTEDVFMEKSDKLDVQISAIEESSISDIEYKVESIVNKRLKNC